MGVALRVDLDHPVFGVFEYLASETVGNMGKHRDSIAIGKTTFLNAPLPIVLSWSLKLMDSVFHMLSKA